MNTAESQDQLRFAVLSSDRRLSEWEVRAVARAGESAELVARLITDGTVAKPGLVERVAEKVAMRQSAVHDGQQPNASDVIHLAEDGADERIGDLDLDFVLAFEPTRALLSMTEGLDARARLGIWTYAFTCADGTAALPPGFDNVLRGDALASVSLVRLSASGACEPLEQAWRRTKPHSYSQTRQELTTEAAELAARRLRRHASTAVDTHPLRLPETARRGNVVAARLLASVMARAIAHLARRALFRQDWNVGLVRRPIRDVLSEMHPRDVEWLPVRDGDTFLADPFGVPLPGGRILLLAEEFTGASARGRIVAATIEGTRYVEPPQPLLEPESHLSYPYVVFDSEEWTLTPETSSTVNVVHYRLDTAAVRAEPIGQSLTGFAASDPTIVRHDGRWWLFATDATRDADSHLHIWHSESSRGPWTAHPLNPVKCDVRSARPAGTPFVIDGVLHRPAQDGSREYGGAIVINRVDVLTTEAFAETTVARFDPDPDGPYPSGSHTLSAAGDWTLVDGKRFRFAPLAKVRRRLPRGLQRGLRATG